MTSLDLDRPNCACPVLSAFARRLNDASWPTADERNKAMKPLVPLLVDTYGKTNKEKVIYRFADLAVRQWAPLALESAARHLGRRGRYDRSKSLFMWAKKLRALNEINSQKTANVGHREAREARKAINDDITTYTASAACAIDAAAYTASAACAIDTAAIVAAIAASAADHAAASAAADHAAAATKLHILREAAELIARLCREVQSQ